MRKLADGVAATVDECEEAGGSEAKQLGRVARFEDDELDSTAVEATVAEVVAAAAATAVRTIAEWLTMVDDDEDGEAAEAAEERVVRFTGALSAGAAADAAAADAYVGVEPLDLRFPARMGERKEGRRGQCHEFSEFFNQVQKFIFENMMNMN